MKEIERYTKGADQMRLARAAMARTMAARKGVARNLTDKISKLARPNHANNNKKESDNEAGRCRTTDCTAYELQDEPTLGMPWQAAALIYQNPPAWMEAIWFRLGVLILGLVAIWASVHFNVWSKKQQAINSLAEDVAWAIHNLLNRNPPPRTNAEMDKWQADFSEWCGRVSGKLENRAFFTRADQLHFDVLGFIDRIALTGTPNFDALLSQLRLKLDRLRDVINWMQQRR